MNKLIFIIVLLCSFLTTTFAQKTPTLLVYDFQTKTLDTLSGFEYDGSITYNKTTYFEGETEKLNLDLDIPKSNLVEKTNFTYQLPVADMYDKLAFPFSSVVKLVIPSNDDRHQCTGVMVSENFVMSSSHCVVRPYHNNVVVDDLDAIIGFDNGLNSSDNMRAKVVRVYYLQDWNIGEGEDIALYELDKSFGSKSGWMSIGFENEDKNFNGEVLHKISYPAYDTPLSQDDFTGDDMHLSYGVVDHVVPNYLGIKNHLVGKGGESGSPLFKTDNVDNYTAYGVLTWAGFHNHSRLDAPMFYAFQNVLDPKPLQVKSDKIKSFEVNQYESDEAYIVWTMESEEDVLGYEVEKSYDGVDFMQIDYVKVKNKLLYSIKDKNPTTGKSFYRVKIYDNKGEFTVSENRELEIGDDRKFEINIYPNPVVDFLNISSDDDLEEAKEMLIFNSSGKLVETHMLSEETTIPMTHLESGMYYLNIRGTDAMETYSIIKE